MYTRVRVDARFDFGDHLAQIEILRHDEVRRVLQIAAVFWEPRDERVPHAPFGVADLSSVPADEMPSVDQREGAQEMRFVFRLLQIRLGVAREPAVDAEAAPLVAARPNADPIGIAGLQRPADVQACRDAFLAPTTRDVPYHVVAWIP